MSHRTLRLAATGLAGLLLFVAGLALAGDSVLDPSDPPVRLKKKEKPDKKDQAAKDKDATGQGRETPQQPPAKKDQVKKPARPEFDDAAEEIKELVARVLKNMRDAETRLVKKNPGKGTQDVQRRILEDLDKLIDQTQKQPPPQECSCSKQGKQLSQKKSSSRNSQSKSGSSQSGSQASARPNQGQGAQKNSPGSTAKNNQGAGTEKSRKEGGKNNPNGKENKSQQAGNLGGNGGSDKTPRGDRHHMAEIFKDVWGHLPETLRQEMDAYSRAKFVPEYDGMLRQYYRTISEQGRSKKGD